MKKDKIVKESEPLTTEMPRLPENWFQIVIEQWYADIRGGWGYEMADACVIKTEDYESGINAEYDLAKQRVIMALQHLAWETKDDIFYRLANMELSSQALCVKDGKPYDKMTFTCTAAPWVYDENIEDFFLATDKRKITFEETFWFDISNFFGVRDKDEEEEKPETAKGDDVSASTECPGTTAPASKRAKKPVRKATKKNAKS